jgi:hypothetical protein
MRRGRALSAGWPALWPHQPKCAAAFTASAQTSLAALATADADLDLVAYEMTRPAEVAGGVLTPGTR